MRFARIEGWGSLGLQQAETELYADEPAPKRATAAVPSRPLWIATVWVGKSFKTPVDTKALDVLEMSSREAFDAIQQAALSARADDATSAYEELKRRRQQG